MKRVTRDRVYFCSVQETHRRTIFTEDGKFFVKWQGGFVEVNNKRGYWRTNE